MSNSQHPPTEIIYQGRRVPVVVFYSVSGGVGKTTLARKFAELVTIAPGLGEHRPNVLLIDLDAGARGLTYRLVRQGLSKNVRTVHEVMKQRDILAAAALNVTSEVSLAGGNPADSKPGKLYLMPAALPDAHGVFDVLSTIPKDELLELLYNMIEKLVVDNDISCVVIDCAPGVDPYTAAAATLADIPLFIGKNDPISYEQIWTLPRRFQEWYPQFEPETQKVIINVVAVQDTLDKRSKQYPVYDWIPLISDVILETEGSTHIEPLRMRLLEKYIVDIIQKVFGDVILGWDHLIPKAPDVVGREGEELIERLRDCEKAPKVQLLRRLEYLRWVGAALVVIGIVLIVLRQALIDIFPILLTNIGIASVIVGILLFIVGWYAEKERRRILTMAYELVSGGANKMVQMIVEGPSQRKKLKEMEKLASTIPAKKKKSPPLQLSELHHSEE